MAKYPNKEALRTAILDIYLDAMRDFIPRSLEKVRGTTSEELISIVLECEPDDSKEAIDISNIPRLIRKYWSDIFNREFTSKRLGGDAKKVAWNATELIVETRNHVVHPNTGEIDSEYTRTCLSLIADVLDKINAPAEKRQVETIRDILFSNDTDERIADMTKQLDAAKAEKTDLKKQVKTKSDRLEEVEAERIAYDKRLETVSIQLKIAVAGKTVAEERLSDISNRFEEAEVEKTELEKRLETTSDQLKDVEREKAAYKKRVETIPDQLEEVNAEKTKYRKALTAASNQLATLKSVNAQLEERLETTSTRLEDVEAELTACKEDLAHTLRQLEGTKEGQAEYLSAEERLARALTESEIEEAEETKYKKGFRVALPTGKEMEQPALRLLIDRKEHRRVEIIDWLTEHFSLTDDERRYLSRTGQAEKHLMNKGLIERVRTGYYRITVNGLEVLHRNGTDEDSVYPNEVYPETSSYPGNTPKSPKSQRKWRRPGAVAALRDPAEILKAEAKIVKIRNPSEKARLERELREAKRAVYGSAT